MLGWTKIAESDDVVCFRQSRPESNFDALKAEIFIPKPPSFVSEFILDNWNENNTELDDENVESS